MDIYIYNQMSRNRYKWKNKLTLLFTSDNIIFVFVISECRLERRFIKDEEKQQVQVFVHCYSCCNKEEVQLRKKRDESRRYDCVRTLIDTYIRVKKSFSIIRPGRFLYTYITIYVMAINE